MKLKEQKLRREEDYAVFKAFLRCIKEHGLWNRIHGYRELIEKCYKSRDDHRGESFLTNIGFWPGDTSSGMSRPEIKLLYMSMIINAIKINELKVKPGQMGIVENLKSSFLNCIAGSGLIMRDDYEEIISSAISKCFGFDKSMNIKETVDLVLMGKKLGIPF
jgi:hypothetical protein